MFENVLGQAASGQLIDDIAAGVLAPAMLFSGPPASGKGTAALELGRVISCEAIEDKKIEGKKIEDKKIEGKAVWNCACPACSRYRRLIHPDLLCLGKRPFYTEIAASAETFIREPDHSPVKVLFIRSVRKLLNRFNPVLWEDEPKAAKISSLVNSMEEDLDELELIKDRDSLCKLAEGIKKDAFKLESEGISETIPIAQIRRAAYWSRLAPAGNAKLLVIEHADRMQDEARNSLLKLLEEPPSHIYLVLTSSRPGSILPTILSRLRPYRFYNREPAVEAEVIRRVFRDSRPGIRGIDTYLDSFLPVSPELLDTLAAFFAASVAFKAAGLLKKQGRSLPEELVLLGQYCAPKAEAAGFGRPCSDSKAVIEIILEKAEKFELSSLFSRFLHLLLENVSKGNGSFLPRIAYNGIWKDCSDWAENAVGVFNLRPVQVLEKLFADLSRRMTEL